MSVPPGQLLIQVGLGTAFPARGKSYDLGRAEGMVNIFLEGNDKQGLWSYSLIRIIKSLNIKFLSVIEQFIF